MLSGILLEDDIITNVRHHRNGNLKEKFISLRNFCLIVIILISLIIITILTFSFITSARIITVDDDAEADYSIIQEAIDNSTDGDTISIKNGIYCESIEVTKSIIIEGNDRNTTVIDGLNEQKVINIESSNVTLMNLSIKNGSSSGGILAAIYVNSYNDIIIDNCRIFDTFRGIWLNRGNNITI